MKKIGIVMGSDSDLPVVKKAMDTLDEFGVPFEVHVFSAHRTPKEASDFAKNARKRRLRSHNRRCGNGGSPCGSRCGQYHPSCCGNSL